MYIYTLYICTCTWTIFFILHNSFSLSPSLSHFFSSSTSRDHPSTSGTNPQDWRRTTAALWGLLSSWPSRILLVPSQKWGHAVGTSHQLQHQQVICTCIYTHTLQLPFLSWEMPLPLLNPIPPTRVRILRTRATFKLRVKIWPAPAGLPWWLNWSSICTACRMLWVWVLPEAALFLQRKRVVFRCTCLAVPCAYDWSHMYTYMYVHVHVEVT